MKEKDSMITKEIFEDKDDSTDTVKEPDGRKKELIRTVKFTLFSLSAGAIQMGSNALMYKVFGWNATVSYLIALVLSVLWNFTFNRKFTFKSANNIPIAMLKVAGYYCVFTPLSSLFEDFLVYTLGWDGLIATLINMFINFVTEFLFDRFVVFGKTIDTNEQAAK